MVEGLGLRTDTTGWIRESLRTSLFRNSFFLLATSGLGSILGFVFWIIVARAYAPADVGLAAALYGVILLLATAATLGLTFGMIRYLPTSADRAGLINASFLVAGVASLVLGLAFLAGLDLWAPSLVFVRSSVGLAGACLLSIGGFALASVLDTSFVASRRADYGTARGVIFGIIRLPIPLLVVAALGFLGILFAWALALALSLAIGAFLFLPRVLPGYRPIPSLRGLQGHGLIGYSLWNHAAATVGSAPLALLPLLIVNTFGARAGGEAGAYYYAAAAIASVVYFVPGAFTTSLFVEGSHPKASYARDTRTAVMFSLALLGLGILAAVVLGPWLLSLFGAAYSAQGYATLVVMAAASPAILANAVFGTHLRVEKRVRPLLAITTIGAVTVLALAFVLLPALGIVGAATAFLVGNVVTVPLFALERGRNGHAPPGPSA